MTDAQLPLPGMDPAAIPKPRTRHRFGLPSGQYAEACCKSCPVRRRYGPFRVKQGYGHQWSADGKDWTDVEIPCRVKAKRKR